MESVNYAEYRKLPEKEKMRRIKEAAQHEKHRRENPQGECQFGEEWWLPFEVYQGKQKVKLCTYRQYKSQDFSDAKAVLIMFHGLNSHINHGSHIAAALAEVGVITVGFDHRGFGKSEGKEGFVESLESHLYDAKIFVEMVKKAHPGLPYFAMGLSMGGMTTYHLALRHKGMFSGVILMAPALRNMVGGTLVNLVCGIASLLPKSTRLIAPPRGQCTKNPKVTEDIVKDKYSFQDRASLKTLQTIIHTMDISPETFKHFDIPFVIVQGGLDKLVNPLGAFELYDQSKSQDKEVAVH